MKPLPIPERIGEKIYFIRRQKVMLSTDLAKLYEVEPKVLVQAMKRNRSRFPVDFMFQLNATEFRSLKSQFVTSNVGRGGIRRAAPYAFTEQGIAMLSSVLNSKRAIGVNIAIMRTFVKLRYLLATHRDLAEKLEMMEKKYDAKFKIVFAMMKELMMPSLPPPPERPIGF